MGDLTNQKAPNVEPIKLKKMRAIRVNNASKSMVNILIEDDKRFVYSNGKLLIMGTANIEKFKNYIFAKGLLEADVDNLSCDLVEVYDADDIYDL